MIILIYYKNNIYSIYFIFTFSSGIPLLPGEFFPLAWIDSSQYI